MFIHNVVQTMGSLLATVVMTLPAMVMSSGSELPLSNVALLGAGCFLLYSLAEGYLAYPQETFFNKESKCHIFFLNIVQGTLLLLTLQMMTICAGPSIRDAAPNIMFGFLLFSIGAFLRLSAVNKLGKAFSSSLLPRTKKRINTGIYAVVPHPGELGLIFVVSGYGTMLMSWNGLTVCFFIAATVISLVRIILEELAMTQCYCRGAVPRDTA